MLKRDEIIAQYQKIRDQLFTERKVEVKTYLVHAHHTGCTGQFVSTGEAYMTYPPKYIHLCSVCGQDEAFKEKYPVLRTEPC